MIKKVFVVTLSSMPRDEQILAEATLDAAKAVGGQPSKQVQVVPFSNLPQHKLKRICVVTLEAFAPFLSICLTSHKFEILGQLVATASSPIWATGDPYKDPEMALLTGLMPTLRWRRDLDGSNLVANGLENAKNAASAVKHLSSV